MMKCMGKQIQIRIYPDGKIESQTVNIKGKTCLKYIKLLESLLDSKVVDSEFTSEYYETSNILENIETLKVKYNNE